jgi:hypothetical protein
MWDDYTVPGGTFRENLYGIPGQTYLPDHHPGSKFKWDVLKSDANDDTREVEHKTNAIVESGNAMEVSA